MRRLDDSDAPRPEIIANEMKYRQQLQNVTTAHCRASALSGRDTLEPSQIEKSAVAIFDFCRSESDSTHYSNDHYGSIGELRPDADDGSCKGGSSTRRTWHPLHAETQETVVTAVDNDNATSIGHLSAYPSSTAGLSILQQVKKPGISTIKSPEEWTEIEITAD